MKNWTIKNRIIFGFTIIVALSSVMGVLAWSSLRTIFTNADTLATDAIPGLAAESDILQNLTHAHLVLIRHVLSTDKSVKQACEAQIQEIGVSSTKLFEGIVAYCKDAEELSDLEKLKQVRANYISTRTAILKLSNEGKLQEAEALLATEGNACYMAYDTVSMALQDYGTKVSTDSANLIQKHAKTSKTMIAAVVLGELAISTILAFIVVTGLNRVLKDVSTRLGEGAEQVTSAAVQVSTASTSLAEGASEQAASLEETSASLEELSSMTKRNSENSQKANELAKQARAAADKGASDVASMSSAMEAIKQSSDDIAKIIKTIDEIAFQTNILALNAAVEAARAGEAGMGFAVVADEVRNLAQRSAQAAKETATKIEGAISRTAQGVDISGKVALTLAEIVTKARQVDELAAEVAGASREQTQGITQINTAVGQMDQVTQGNAASAEESAAAAEELTAQAESVKHSVADLLKLVGGHVSQASSSPSEKFQPKAAKNGSYAKGSKPRKSAPPQRNGNGHGSPSSTPAPVLSSGPKRQGLDIPMDDDFKDF